MVLLDAGVLVVHVQARGDPVGDHPGAEPARGRAVTAAHEAPVEDQADLVSATGSSTAAKALSNGVNPIPAQGRLTLAQWLPLMHNFALYGKYHSMPRRAGAKPR